MIKAGFFSATKTLRRILASSGSRDIISRRSSWAGFRIMAAWSFWASFALIWNRNKPAKTTWSVTWFSNGQFSKTNKPLKKTQIPPPPYSLCTYPVQQGLGHPFQGSWYRSSWFLGNCEVRWRCLPCTLCNFIFILQNQRNQSLLHLRTQDDRTIPPDLVLTNALFQYNNPVYRALVYQLKHGFMKHWLYIINPKYITNG